MLCLLSLNGCTSVGYYAQSVGGHLGVLSKRTPIEEVLEKPDLSELLRERLEVATELRSFASDTLALPENDSYRDYVDVGADYVVWNVVVAPSLALTPERSCFLFVGCIAYRGYYAKADALAYAASWRDRGYDVSVGGVRAYSTLGWLDDPLLSTMLAGAETYMARIIFHELAHQVVYIKDDTGFNEAFAVAVEQAGVEKWLRERRDEKHRERYNLATERHREFLALVREARAGLAAIYKSERADDEKRALKGNRIEQLRADYRAMRARWGEYAGYDRWFAEDLNNAKLALLGTYNDLVPDFLRLLAREDGDFARFYEAVRELSELPPGERRRRLSAN